MRSSLCNRQDIAVYRDKIKDILDTFALPENDRWHYFAEALPVVMNSEYICYKEERGNGVVGLAYTFSSHGIIPSFGVAVRSGYRGRGIGRDDMLGVLDYIKKTHKFMVSEVRYKNETSIRLHRGCGFKLLFKSRGETQWYYVAYGVKGAVYKMLITPIIYCYVLWRKIYGKAR